MIITIGGKQAEPLGFEVKEDEKLLHGALRNRLTIPYECATGTCGTCRAKLISGELDQCWADAPGRKTLKVERGEFLMCQCVARSNCEIRVPSPVTVLPEEASVPVSMTCSLSDFKKLTPDVMSFSVSLEDKLQFKAGQYMLLQLPEIEGTRAYSMVNHATQTDKLEFVIKHLEGGKCSQWLFDPPEAATEVTLFGPLGHAVFEPQLEHDLLLLAGGSGIAGMMAILTQADQTGYLDHHSIDLIFGVRSAKDIFYLSELKRFCAEYPDTLQVIIALSDAESEAEPGAATGAEPPDLADQLSDSKNLVIAKGGFVHQHIDASRTHANTMAFIAGPPPMVDASIRELIASAEFAADRIRYDKFG